MHLLWLKVRDSLFGDAIAGSSFMALAVLATLASNVVIARALQPSAYGVYSLVITTAILFSIPLHLGASNLVVRQAAIYSHSAYWGLLRGLMRAANLATLGLSALFLLLAIGFWHLGTISADLPTVILGCLIVPAYAVCAIRSALLRGLQRPFLGLIPEQIVKPIVTLALAIVAAALFDLGVHLALLAYLVGAVVGAVVGVLLTLKEFPDASLQHEPIESEYLKWLRSWATFTMFAGLTQLNSAVGIVSLGAGNSTSQAGGYKAITELSMLITFLLSAINLVIAPKVARMFAQGDRANLVRTLVSSARISTIAAAPLVIGLILYGERLMTIIYGAAYAGYGVALGILALGQLVNAMGGSVGLAANMSGNERLSVMATTVALLTNGCLAVLLVPSHGALGAAIAAAIALSVWNLILVVGLKRATNIDCSVFGRTKESSNART